MLIAAFLVDPLHRRVHRVALDPVQPQLAEGEPGAHPDRVGRIAAAPGRSLADEETAGRPSVSPVDVVQADEADVPLASSTIAQTKSFSRGFDLLEEELLLPAADAQVELERRRDLGVVQPDQCVFEVKRPVGWNQPDAFAVEADDLRQFVLRPLSMRSVARILTGLFHPVRQVCASGSIQVRRLERQRAECPWRRL